MAYCVGVAPDKNGAKVCVCVCDAKFTAQHHTLASFGCQMWLTRSLPQVNPPSACSASGSIVLTHRHTHKSQTAPILPLLALLRHMDSHTWSHAAWDRNLRSEQLLFNTQQYFIRRVTTSFLGERERELKWGRIFLHCKIFSCKRNKTKQKNKTWQQSCHLVSVNVWYC